MTDITEAPTADDIVALDRVWEDAIVARDAAALERIASDDLVYSHATCEIDDKATFLDHIVDGPLRFLQVEYEDVDVRIHGSTAVLTCALHLRITDGDDQPGELHFRTTHVWTHDGAQWQLLANQSTHLPDGHPARRWPVSDGA